MGNTTISVQAYRAQPGATSPEVELTATSVIPVKTNSETPFEHSSRPGLTYEQELFRTKWGWAAFALAERAASRPLATD